MKSIKKKVKMGKSQSIPLLDENHGPRYSTIPKSQSSFSQEDNNKNNFEMDQNELQRSPSSTSSQPESPIFPPEFSHPPKKEHSWVTDARKQSAKEPVLDSEDPSFSTAGISTEETWLSGIGQSVVILAVFLLTPSVIFSFIGCIVLRCCIIPNAGRSVRERKKVRYAFFLFLASIVFSLFKDCAIAVAILFSVVKLTVPCYPVVYPLTVLLVIIFCAIFPIMVYEFTGVSFNYGTESKTEMQKNPPKKSKEKQIAVDFMNKNLLSIHKVTNFRHQIILLMQQTPRLLLAIILIVSFLLCSLRGVLFWIPGSPIAKSLNATNTTSNGNTKWENKTDIKLLSFNLDHVVMGLSSLNTLVMSFSLSLIFLSIFIWNLLCLKLWKHLLNNGSNVISQGVEGVAAWWRLYQILLFFSSSPWNPFIFLRITASIIVAILSILLSSTLISPDATRQAKVQSTNRLLSFDNILLVFVAFVVIFNSFSLTLVNRKVSYQLTYLRLRMASLAVTLPNDQERNEGEYHAHLKRFKTRNVRASLQLLQEVSMAVEGAAKAGSFPSIPDFILFAVAIFGLVSIGVAHS